MTDKPKTPAPEAVALAEAMGERAHPEAGKNYPVTGKAELILRNLLASGFRVVPV